MYLQDTAVRRNPSARSGLVIEAAKASPRRDPAMRIGVALLLTSGAALGAINVLVMIRLVAAALGG